MNRKELQTSWLITRGYLAAAQALLPSPPKEDTEEGGRISDADEWLAHNELELALDTIAAIGRVNDCPPAFWQALEAAAENMGLERDYP